MRNTITLLIVLAAIGGGIYFFYQSREGNANPEETLRKIASGHTASAKEVARVFVHAPKQAAEKFGESTIMVRGKVKEIRVIGVRQVNFEIVLEGVDGKDVAVRSNNEKYASSNKDWSRMKTTLGQLYSEFGRSGMRRHITSIDEDFRSSPMRFISNEPKYVVFESTQRW